MVTAYADARPILAPVFPGWPAPLVLDGEDRAGELLDELDSLISDLEGALADRDAARSTVAQTERRCTIIGERLALVRDSLELLPRA